MAKQTFTVGQVLTAAQVAAVQANDYNQTVSVKTASYTLVAADVGTRIEMNSGSATTVTVNTALFAAGDTLVIQNKGAGVSTVTAGTATVSTSGSLALAQYDQGTLYFVSTGVAIFFNATAGAADIPKSILTTNGDMIYATGASTPVRLGIGSSAQVLTVSGGIPTWATPAAGTSGLNLISTTALSGSGSYSINNCFSATYTNYKVIFTGTASAAMVYFRLRVSGTDNTSANYKWAGTYQNFITGGNLVEYCASADTTWRFGYVDTSGSFVSAEILQPYLSNGTSYVSEYVQNKASNDGYPGVYRGATTVTTSYTGFTVYVASGTFAGSISVYGYGV